MIITNDFELRFERMGLCGETTFDTARGDLDPVGALHAAARRAAEDGDGLFVEVGRRRISARHRRAQKRSR